MHYLSAYLLTLSYLIASTASATDDVRRYLKTYDCGFVEIQAKGAACVGEMDCPSINNVAYEHLTYHIQGQSHSLPTLPKQFPHGPEILHDPMRIYRISDLKCQDNRSVAILYWGGGNCSSGCELMVSYSAVDGRLVPIRIMDSYWDSVPFVKEYSVLDEEPFTKWIDPRP